MCRKAGRQAGQQQQRTGGSRSRSIEATLRRRYSLKPVTAESTNILTLLALLFVSQQECKDLVFGP